jgi:hypothetical protein
MLSVALVPAASLAGLLLCGWLFLRSTILTQYDAASQRNILVQLLFAAVFSLSANLLQLLVFEILDIMDPGCDAPWRCQRWLPAGPKLPA